MRRSVAAAVAVAMGAGGAEAAAAPAPGDLGGGSIGSGFSYDRGGKFTLVGVRVDPSLQRVLVNARMSNRCGSADVSRRVPLAADGSFTLRATIRERVQFERFRRKTARIVIFGRVDGGAGSGNARARVTYRRGGRVLSRCRMRPQGFQLRAAAPEAAAGAARPGTTYHGLTSQRANRPRPIVLRVDRLGRRVRAEIFQYRRRCGTGHYTIVNITPGTRIGAGGAFARTERFALGYSNAVERFRVRLRGQFTPNGVRGTISATSVARRRSDGAVIDRCRTGQIGFAASP
jgi:hypothetical protein